jgi:hypothetical protein
MAEAAANNATKEEVIQSIMKSKYAPYAAALSDAYVEVLAARGKEAAAAKAAAEKADKPAPAGKKNAPMPKYGPVDEQRNRELLEGTDAPGEGPVTRPGGMDIITDPDRQEYLLNPDRRKDDEVHRERSDARKENTKSLDKLIEKVNDTDASPAAVENLKMRLMDLNDEQDKYLAEKGDNSPSLNKKIQKAKDTLDRWNEPYDIGVGPVGTRSRSSLDDSIKTIKNLISVSSGKAKKRFASKVVEKKHISMEKRMALTIEYQKGPNLTQSFFIARDGNSIYRCAAGDVLPIVVQDRIMTDDPGVATPEQIVSDLASKYSSVRDIKQWAKRRRKKNRQAVLKKEESMKTEAMQDEKSKESPMDSKMDFDKPKSEDKKPSGDSAAKKLKDKLMNLSPKKDEKAPADKPGFEAKKPGDAPSDKGGSMSDKKEASDKSNAILSALENLTAFVRTKMEKEAAAIDSIKAPIDAGEKANDASAGSGEFKPPTAMETQTEKTPQHSDGMTSHQGEKVNAGSGKLPTENAKVPMDKGAAKEDAIKKEAIDQGWSMNSKELEKEPKAPAPKQAQPDVVSWDEKESKSESVKAATGGDSASKVKKYFSSYKSKGLGEAPVAMDLKSSLGEEVRMLRKALDAEKAEKGKLIEKERLANVADSIYEIVSSLREKHVIQAGKEDKVIDLLTTKFASAEQLDGVKGLVGFFSKNASAIAEGQEEEGSEDLGVGRVVPQTFETVENTEDAISELSRIWNL